MWSETSNMIMTVLTTKRGTQLFSRLERSGGLFGRDYLVEIQTGKGYRLIVETVGVSNLWAKAIETTSTQRTWRHTPGAVFFAGGARTQLKCCLIACWVK